MRVATKWLKLEESRGFHSKVALYHSYLPIKFDDDIQGGLKICGVVFNFVAPYLEDNAR